ncbi:MAG: segregation/condensation protein A [SAR324 cluster bacterium]|nr:segregation/condensation protein A [SAR324 cluster bacterium]
MNPVAIPEEFAIFPNPDNPLEIKLQVFEGPLDLLLHLIRKKELDIYEVRLSDLTASYLSYLNIMQSINLDIAGEFLDIAATLILIKSRRLLPKPKTEEVVPDEDDPEELLRLRLIEYQKYKDAAYKLSVRDILGRDVFGRPEQEEILLADIEEKDPVFEEVSIYALMEAFQRVMERRPKITTHIVEMEKYRIEDRINELIDKFWLSPQILFEDMFTGDLSKSFIILTFMAMLEMAKMKIIRVVQLESMGPIHCTIHDDFELSVEKWNIQQQSDLELEVA